MVMDVETKGRKYQKTQRIVMPRIITTGFVRRMERRNVTIRIFGKIGSRRNLAMEATIIAFLALRTVTMIGLTMVIECVCCLVCEWSCFFGQ